MATVYLDPAMVPANLRGEYAGNKFRAIVCEIVTIPIDAGLWSGGTREIYHLIDLATGKQIPFPNQDSSPFNTDRRETIVKLETGYAVVKYSTMQGVETGLTFYLRPENAAPLLPQIVELTDAQKKVLAITRSYIASYRKEAAFAAGIGTKEWDRIKTDLIALGMMKKNGAITIKGKNAIGDFRV